LLRAAAPCLVRSSIVKGRLGVGVRILFIDCNCTSLPLFTVLLFLSVGVGGSALNSWYKVRYKLSILLSRGSVVCCCGSVGGTVRPSVGCVNSSAITSSSRGRKAFQSILGLVVRIRSFFFLRVYLVLHR